MELFKPSINLTRLFYRPRRILGGIYSEFLRAISTILIEWHYEGFWDFRNQLRSHNGGTKTQRLVYRHYMRRFGAYIGLDAKISSIPVFPHNLNGVFISNMSKIGKNVVIFQQVTIGSNTIPGHPRAGSPTIGDNVYIGAGAKIIGKVTIGDNCRIGANCVVVKDMPPNTTAVAASTRFIYSDTVLENSFVPADEFIRIKENEEKSSSSRDGIMPRNMSSDSDSAIANGGG